MNDFLFEQSAWEIALGKLRPGSTISALRLLTLLEGEDEESAQDALQVLEDNRITLDISDLPAVDPGAELAKRLELERKLVQEGRLLPNLDANDPLRLYLEEIAATPAAGDPNILAPQAASGDEGAAAMLVNLSLYKVVSHAEDLAGRGVLLLDLIQEGSLGLWEGILNYPGNVDFENYIDWWITQAMAKTLFLQARAGGAGEKMRSLMERYRTADRQLLTSLGRNPTLEEIALAMGISPEEAGIVEDMLQNAKLLAQAKQAAEPKQESEEDDQSVENTALFQSRQRILDMLASLSEQEAKVLTLRFGLEGGLPLSPQDAGKKLGMTADQVVALEAAALGKLRQIHK